MILKVSILLLYLVGFASALPPYVMIYSQTCTDPSRMCGQLYIAFFLTFYLTVATVTSY